jgi:DNA-directed RNA polymerase subunit M/transcription elongation factor TFIIS
MTTEIHINQTKLFMEHFPYRYPLPVYIYKNDTYPNQPDRIIKLILFLACARTNKIFRESVDINQQYKIIIKIERSCYNHTIRKVREDNLPCSWDSEHFQTMYNAICTEKANNLNEQSLIGSSYLVENIINGTINPSSVGSMSPHQMSPHSEDQYLIDMKNRRLEIKIDNQRYTTMHKCPKCYAKKATFYEKQTRSADEGKSVFYECLECSFEWKES